MTLYEHVMLGGTLSLAAGLRRQYGWPIVALAGVAAVLPDWDGVSLVFGGAAYDRAHRIWGHNVLAALLIGAAVGAVEYFANTYERLARMARSLVTAHRPARPSPTIDAAVRPNHSTESSSPLSLFDEAASSASPPARPGALAGPVPSGRSLLVWTLTGALAALSHLPADLVYSGHPGMESWPLELLWPFSTRAWAFPLVPWGDVGATLIFVAEMFALARRPSRSELIARLTLAALLSYIPLRALLAGVASPS